jgi:hypothetical protein
LVFKLTVKHYHVALLDTVGSEGAREHLDLVEQLHVCVLLLDTRDGAVVYYGNGVSIASEDVPVNAVIARRYFAIGEPSPRLEVALVLYRLRGPLQCRGWLLVPDQPFGLARPEFFGVFEAVTEDRVLGVRPRWRHFMI